MKKICLILMLLPSYCLFAQPCEGFYYLQANKTIEMTITNKKGKVTGKNVYTVSNVNKSGGAVSSTINSEMFDNNGKSIAKASNNVRCSGGNMKMDMKMFISSAQQQQMGQDATGGSEALLEYPATMKEGDELNDGHFSMDFKGQSGIGSHLEINITNRKVEGKEIITTTAGTWECFKISYHSKIVLKIVVGIPVNADVIEWYAPGFGVVKTESGAGKTEITAIH